MPECLLCSPLPCICEDELFEPSKPLRGRLLDSLVKVYESPKREFVSPLFDALPGEEFTLVFQSQHAFRVLGMCTLNTAGSDWQVERVTVGLADQLINSPVPFEVFRRDVVIEHIPVGKQLRVVIRNRTTYKRDLQVLLFVQYT